MLSFLLSKSELWGHIGTFVVGLVANAVIIYIAWSRSRGEIRKIRFEMRNQFAKDLLQARLACYSQLYSVLSEFVKVALGFREGRNQYRPVTFEELTNLNSALNDWDSTHAVLLSGNATTRVFKFRSAIRDLLEELQASRSATESEFDDLMYHIERVEVALKTDIGVFDVDEHMRLSRPQQYREVEPQHDLSSRKLGRAKHPNVSP